MVPSSKTPRQRKGLCISVPSVKDANARRPLHPKKVGTPPMLPSSTPPRAGYSTYEHIQNMVTRPYAAQKNRRQRTTSSFPGTGYHNGTKIVDTRKSLGVKRKAATLIVPGVTLNHHHRSNQQQSAAQKQEIKQHFETTTKRELKISRMEDDNSSVDPARSPPPPMTTESELKISPRNSLEDTLRSPSSATASTSKEPPSAGSENDRRRTRRSNRKLKKRSSFVDGRQAECTLLVYPFAGDATEIEDAAKGLTEASRSVGMLGNSRDEPDISPYSKDEDEESTATTRQRAHFVTINVGDYERLDPGEWLNDSLVDFWMQWISRDVTTLDSKFHLFTSHFFTTLSSGGPEAVASWTRRKKINIFKKRLIFIPINKQMHWSLCVIVNPGALVEGGDRPRTQDDPLSCMIFMDSLRMHNKKIVARHVRKWLNSEWQRVSTENLDENSPSIVKEPFRGDSFRMFCPKVPLQNNTWDCGVFVCRYAYAIYELRQKEFTYGDAGMYTVGGVATGSGSRAFHDLISDGAEFDFNMEDIARFREEFKTLIERLSALYQKMKIAEKMSEQEEQRS